MRKPEPEMDASGFVLLADFVPSIVQEIRYHSTYNFIGDRIDGYEDPVALCTRECARALKGVAAELFVQGYRLKVFDAYRPTTAVKHFVLWGIEDADQRMKPYFYPNIDKTDTFKLGYIAARSSHSRGSTVDLTLLDMATGREVDMGSPLRPVRRALAPLVHGCHKRAVPGAHAAAAGHGARRLRPLRVRVVALHVGRRALPRPGVLLPRGRREREGIGSCHGAV
ncbi:MAG: M15 family metallopeptidase [Atopobiaceae bacterium]|nr:M15 family metallopeptidase [Atopobiaceae bacterium]